VDKVLFVNCGQSGSRLRCGFQRQLQWRTTNYSLRVAEGSGRQTEKTKRATPQRIATGISLVSLAVGFSILGTRWRY
jgi:hypothetical protein